MHNNKNISMQLYARKEFPIVEASQQNKLEQWSYYKFQAHYIIMKYYIVEWNFMHIYIGIVQLI